MRSIHLTPFTLIKVLGTFLFLAGIAYWVLNLPQNTPADPLIVETTTLLETQGSTLSAHRYKQLQQALSEASDPKTAALYHDLLKLSCIRVIDRALADAHPSFPYLRYHPYPEDPPNWKQLQLLCEEHITHATQRLRRIQSLARNVENTHFELGPTHVRIVMKQTSSLFGDRLFSEPTDIVYLPKDIWLEHVLGELPASY